MIIGDRRPSPAPVGTWGAGKVLALLVAGALVGLLLLTGLGLALYYGLDPSPAPGRPAASVPPQGAAGGRGLPAALRASLVTAGSEARRKAQGFLFHPGATGKGKTGRVNCVNLR